MADYSRFFPSGESEKPDYSNYFPENSGKIVPGPTITDQDYERMQASPTMGMSAWDAAMVAAGRGMNRLGAGIQQPLLKMVPATSGELSALQADQETRKAEYDPLRRQFPMATGIGEAIPYMAVPPSSGVLGGSAIVGGLEALKYGTPQERLTSGVVGGVSNLVGSLAGRAAGGLFSPFASDAMTATKRAALESAENIGFKPRLSQTTGSPFWARVEDAAARIPGGAGVMQAHEAANARAVNRAAAGAMGETADELTPQVFSNAASRTGKVFNDIKALGNVNGKPPIQIDANVGNVADDILRQQSKKMTKNTALTDIATQAKMLSQNRGRIDGETYQLVRSDLTNAAFEATGTEKTMYSRLLSALDDAAETSLRALGLDSLADNLRTVRPQYANMKLLEKGTVAQGGNASPAKVAQALRTQNPGAFREGRMAGNPLYDVAQIGENLPPLRAGSQTFERGEMNPLTLPFTAPLAYAGAKVSTSPSFNWYMQNVAPTRTMGVLSQMVNPPVRAVGAGMFGNLLVPPILAEQ